VQEEEVGGWVGQKAEWAGWLLGWLGQKPGEIPFGNKIEFLNLQSLGQYGQGDLGGIFM
jgi:hypothetical protein